MPGKVSICIVGDVLVNREAPESIFAYTGSILKGADIAFCQLETMYSERGGPQVHSRNPLRAHPRNVSALTSAGFDVISLAGNHTMDWGVDAFFDTIALLHQNGIATIGVGKNLAEARKPAILERKGTRVAFLGYSAILPAGYWALVDRPGFVPIKVFTIYENIDPGQPGNAGRVITMADHEDLEAMKNDIESVRPLVDVIVVSIHWGIHHTPAVIAMYEKEVGQAAISSGADLVIGHHAHILKGINVYKGKVIFHNLGNFAMDIPLDKLAARSPSFKEHMDDYGWKLDPDWAAYPFREDSRMTMLAKCVISDRKMERVSFLPCLINKNAQPRPLPPGDDDFSKVVAYVNEISRSQGLHANFTVAGDEVVVTT